MKNKKGILFEKKNYDITSFTGIVSGTAKIKETHVHGSTNSNTSSSISSFTTDHHEFFLTGESGAEKSFHLVDFDFPMREGQKITMFWVIPEGLERGPYFISYNHNTDEQYSIKPVDIRQYFSWPKIKRRILYSILVVILTLYYGSVWSSDTEVFFVAFPHYVFAFAFSGLVVSIISGIGSFLSKRKAKRFLNSAQIMSIIENIKH